MNLLVNGGLGLIIFVIRLYKVKILIFDVLRAKQVVVLVMEGLRDELLSVDTVKHVRHNIDVKVSACIELGQLLPVSIEDCYEDVDSAQHGEFDGFFEEILLSLRESGDPLLVTLDLAEVFSGASVPASLLPFIGHSRVVSPVVRAYEQWVRRSVWELIGARNGL